MPWQSQSEPTTIERVVGGLSYLTAGIAGILYLLLKRDSAQSQWFRFQAFQSILLYLIMVLLKWGGSILIGLVVPLLSMAGPGVGAIVVNVFDIFITAYSLLLLYGAIMAFLGKTAEVPFISNVVRQNMRV